MKQISTRFATTAVLSAIAALILVLAAPAIAADAFELTDAPAAAAEYTPALVAPVVPAKVAVATSTTFQPRIAPKRAARIAATRAPAQTVAGTSQTDRAQVILAGLIAKYPILRGTTVTFGDTRGYQAIAYYQSGRIIISRTHTASLERILNHEIWHIIDYRDNGTINWGENVPPSNAASYRG